MSGLFELSKRELCVLLREMRLQQSLSYSGREGEEQDLKKLFDITLYELHGAPYSLNGPRGVAQQFHHSLDPSGMKRCGSFYGAARQ